MMQMQSRVHHSHTLAHPSSTNAAHANYIQKCKFNTQHVRNGMKIEKSEQESKKGRKRIRNNVDRTVNSEWIVGYLMVANRPVNSENERTKMSHLLHTHKTKKSMYWSQSSVCLCRMIYIFSCIYESITQQSYSMFSSCCSPSHCLLFECSCKYCAFIFYRLCCIMSVSVSLIFLEPINAKTNERKWSQTLTLTLAQPPIAPCWCHTAVNTIVCKQNSNKIINELRNSNGTLLMRLCDLCVTGMTVPKTRTASWVLPLILSWMCVCVCVFM